MTRVPIHFNPKWNSQSCIDSAPSKVQKNTNGSCWPSQCSAHKTQAECVCNSYITSKSTNDYATKGCKWVPNE